MPTIWQGVKAAVEAEPGRWDISSLWRVTCGGSAPPISLMRWYWDELNIEMIQGWGMTETNPLGTLSRKVAKRGQRDLDLDEQLQNAAKAGLPLPGLEIEIFDENWNPLPHDGETIGEVRELLRGLREARVDIVTIGQYLRPSRENLPVVEYVRPEVFDALRAEAESLGFRHVFAGPFVRSSYRAEEALLAAASSVPPGAAPPA